MTADISLTKLDMALENFELIRRTHKFADLLTHAPCAFVCHAKSALQFFAGYAVAGYSEQINSIEPRLQRRVAILEHSSGTRIDMVAAVRARIGTALLKFVKSRVLAAHRA